MAKERSTRRFSLGQVVITSNAHETLPPHDVLQALVRHANADWGDVCEEDWELNNESLVDDSRVLSVYTSAAGTRFWIITEWDRSVTTILLPEDY